MKKTIQEISIIACIACLLGIFSGILFKMVIPYLPGSIPQNNYTEKQ
ncbi:MAG: hypothetical protein KBC30_03155 [Planctomycetes bacterium]|jgi:hypothetical protein|nr:hypothetical protein [Planctomycetota bacterium]HPY74211.1 hypothetical protein [Planctomycetota bacterium]HQB00040.1 hypothetical protein [Planctomycetota bacterium]HRU51253.1 hypothetical protein [Planctomycetota bacterium]